MDAESSLFMRLYLDEDVHKRVASALRLRAFDTISAHEIGRCGCSDEEQLAFASWEKRVIFTFNTLDYLQLHLAWLKQGREHFGIIVSDQLPVGETARRLMALLNQVTAEEMRNQMRWLQAFK
jgi:predicted nuclease of predicted toxin-antitoxin system